MKLKKYLPVILFLVGILVFAGLYFFVIRGNKEDEIPVDEDEVVAELPFGQRPFASLTPTEDGHYLNLVVENISVVGASTMDYELVYTTGDNVQQGVPGSVNIDGKDTYESELLLGSESSGKFRYDEGVSEGTFMLLFRDGDGKSIGKVSTQFHLLAGGSILDSLQKDFTYTLEDTSDAYFVVMSTFGMPKGSDKGTPQAGPFGVFSSGEGPYPGTVEVSGAANRWSGTSWESLDGGQSDDIGVFTGF